MALGWTTWFAIIGLVIAVILLIIYAATTDKNRWLLGTGILIAILSVILITIDIKTTKHDNTKSYTPYSWDNLPVPSSIESLAPPM